MTTAGRRAGAFAAAQLKRPQSRGSTRRLVADLDPRKAHGPVQDKPAPGRSRRSNGPRTRSTAPFAAFGAPARSTRPSPKSPRAQNELDNATSPRDFHRAARRHFMPAAARRADSADRLRRRPDFSSLERHLFKITSQIEALQRPDGIEQSITAFPQAS